MPLFLVAMPFVTSSDALAPSSDALCYLLTSSDALAPSSDALCY